MIRKSIAIICFLSGLSAIPTGAQVMRIDSSRSSILRDKEGNIMISEYIHISGTFEARVELLQNQKIGYFNMVINFTPGEAERFWPMYNEYVHKKEELRNRGKKLLQQFSSPITTETVSDNEIKALVDLYMMVCEKERQLQTEYYRKFLTILPAKKVALVYKAEDDFQAYLLRTLSGRK
ncbi:MAG: hypothetical protein LBD91_04960 [Prevotellaceae bacterium]|jgi:hypothetical protein|nr:hypothetical protein [Prevotellaceae bacterium]